MILRVLKGIWKPNLLLINVGLGNLKFFYSPPACNVGGQKDHVDPGRAVSWQLYLLTVAHSHQVLWWVNMHICSLQYIFKTIPKHDRQTYNITVWPARSTSWMPQYVLIQVKLELINSNWVPKDLPTPWPGEGTACDCVDIPSGEQGRSCFSLFISLAVRASTDICYRGLSSLSRSCSHNGWSTLILLDIGGFIVKLRRLRLPDAAELGIGQVWESQHTLWRSSVGRVRMRVSDRMTA